MKVMSLKLSVVLINKIICMMFHEMDENKILEYENKWMERAYEYYKKLSTISPKT